MLRAVVATWSLLLALSFAAPVAVAEPPPVAVAQAESSEQDRARSEVIEPGEVVARGQRRGKGSGFWTSDVPTEDRPYRWAYLGVGIGVAALMGVILLSLIRRAARQRES
jgi:hypothetical protein